MEKLDVDILNNSYKELESTFCNYMAQSCRVLLYIFKHQSGINIKVKKDVGEDIYELCWTGNVTEKTLLSFSEKNRTADFSAMALAVLIANFYLKFDYISTSDKGTGVDFFLHLNSRDEEDIFGINNVVAKLEVSGVVEEDKSHKISTRVLEKKAQTQKGKHTQGTAYVSVTEFKTPKSVFQKA